MVSSQHVKEVAEKLVATRQMSLLSDLAGNNPTAVREMAEIWLEWYAEQGLKTSKEREQERLALDTNSGQGQTPAEVREHLIRAMHRVVRAMHDGSCPNCGHLAPSHKFELPEQLALSDDVLIAHRCPACLYAITVAHEREVLQLFLPIAQRSRDVLDDWREGRLHITDKEATRVRSDQP
jgi:hypothetical protein